MSVGASIVGTANDTDPWLQTYTGRAFYVLNPRPEDVHIEDIAHALANLCRFGGHCRKHYSVAQHSVLVALAGPIEERLEGLLHDAAEAYVIDIPRPLKKVLAGYVDIEDAVHEAIRARFGLRPISEQVKLADTTVLATEMRDLLGPAPLPRRHDTHPKLRDIIEPWTADMAEEEFLLLFTKLMRQRAGM